MKITRYVNGEKFKKPLKEIVIKSDVIRETIDKVNARIKVDGENKRVINE